MAGFWYFSTCLRIDRAHDRVLQQVDRPRIDIRAGVDEDEDVALRRDDGGDAGPLDAWQRAQFDGRRRHGRAGMAGAHDCLGLAALHQVHRAADRGILLPAHGFDGAVAHLHHLGGVDDLDPRIRELVRLSTPP